MIAHVHHLTTRNGHTVRVRPLRPTDTHHLVALYEHMSPQSRQQRFRGFLKKPERPYIWQTAQEIAHTTLPHGFGLLAFSDLPGEPRTPVALVRYRLSPPDEAEISISVRDELQGQGVGSHLIMLIREYARRHGVSRIFGLMPSDSQFLTALERQALPGTEIIPQGSNTYISVLV